jgi:hypothetical protein
VEIVEIPSKMNVRAECHQQVDIAAGVRLSAGEGAENLQPGDAVTLAERRQPGLDFVQRQRIDIVRSNLFDSLLINIAQARCLESEVVAPSGVEPEHPFGHENLNLARLPISPRGQRMELFAL